jgi:tryptophanyl-tRNA synthetase
MSKSYDNYILLDDKPEEIRLKIRKMITDPARKRRGDKGHPEVCTVFELYKSYLPERMAGLESECRGALIGCTDCKDELAKAVARDLEPFRERRASLARNPDAVRGILEAGASKVNPIASERLEMARHAMNIGTL